MYHNDDDANLKTQPLSTKTTSQNLMLYIMPIMSIYLYVTMSRISFISVEKVNGTVT